MKQLKFDSEHQDTLVLANEWNMLSATVRYKDEKHIQEGDKIECISSLTGENIGTADVINTDNVRLRRVLDVIRLNWAHYNIDTTHHLVSAMNEYYGDDHYGDKITQNTKVKVIILDPNMEI